MRSARVHVCQHMSHPTESDHEEVQSIFRTPMDALGWQGHYGAYLLARSEVPAPCGPPFVQRRYRMIPSRCTATEPDAQLKHTVLEASDTGQVTQSYNPNKN